MAFKVLLLFLLVEVFLPGNYETLACPSPQYLEIKSRGIIQCSFEEGFFGVFWYNSTNYISDLPIIYYQEFEKKGIGYVSGEYDILPNGSLIIEQVSLLHEGYFTVTFLLSKTHETVVHKVLVVVTVHPGHSYPFVQGCLNTPQCILQVKEEGNLTCSVDEVRPKIQLEWREISKDEKPSILFERQQSSVKENGETFNISLTSSYILDIQKNGTITVECVVKEEFTNIFHLETQVFLLYQADKIETTEETTVPHTSLKLLWIIGGVIVIVILTICCCYLIRKVLKRQSERNKKTEIRYQVVSSHDTQPEKGEHEREAVQAKGLPSKETKGATDRSVHQKTPLLEHETVAGKGELDLTEDTKGKTCGFIKQLKEKYQEVFDDSNAKSIMSWTKYLKENVFVESGMELLLPSKEKEGIENWKPIQSYRDIFTDFEINPKRILLEGMSGYGKSVLTMKLAYDWTYNIKASPLKQIDIFLRLDMRQVNETESFFQAVKSTLLPESTNLRESDIESILKGSQSVLIVLDQYEKYLHKNPNKVSHFTKIVSNEMLHDKQVILTTSLNYMPTELKPHCTRIRLTGFNDEVRKKYLNNLSKDLNGFANMEVFLKENPFLRDISHIPSFSSLFVQLLNETKNNHSYFSVTHFLRFMLPIMEEHKYNMESKFSKKVNKKEEKRNKLGKEAFRILTSKDENSAWSKDYLVELLGPVYLDQIICSGILVAATETKKYKFKDKFFCEWYAAAFLANNVCNNTDDVTTTLDESDLSDLENVYRFTCGFRSDARQIIGDYLESQEDCLAFSMLCRLEGVEDGTKVNKIIRRLCEDEFVVGGEDLLLEQKSTLHLLSIACKLKIMVKRVYLRNCVKHVNLEDRTITLTSGLSMSVAFELRELEVFLPKGEIRDLFINLLKLLAVSSKSTRLRFTGCDLPGSIEVGPILKGLSSKDIEVRWKRNKTLPEYCLNLETGRWKDENGEVLRKAQYDAMIQADVDEYEPDPMV
ncbi:hypothetical protein HOLleu_42680 [Holothuria leucospilota]|uniref:NACHT domain-containing protein n=1 Tax=Holothuria leucospilota TaxID=206669 RepID=A0A9Q0YA34_HOLLE|nr:hypothetical protein HOLleu_42680 [Holothuria leucospilota]